MTDNPQAQDGGNRGDSFGESNSPTPEKARVKWFNILFKNKAGMWTAVFTGVLSVFTLLLWNVAKSTDQTSRASERAYLSFVQLGLGVDLLGNDLRTWSGQEFLLNWLNSGNTPATGVVIETNAQAWRSSLPEGFDFPEIKDKNKTVAAIGPKSSYGTTSDINKDDLMDAWAGKSRIFFWGSVVYKDVFPGDPDRLSEFCVEMTHVTFKQAPETNRPTPRAGGAAAPDQSVPPAIVGGVVGYQWQACREHNCYDQDCKDYFDRVQSAHTN
jgi:hypothetical protein